MPLAETIVLGALSLAGTASAYGIFHSLRARWRNRRELCGHCGGPLYAPGTLEGPSVVQGRLVCSPCAARLRRRYVIALGAVGVLVALALTTATVVATSGGAPLEAIAIVAEYAGCFGGALWWMRRRNRRKLQELERAGEILPESSPLLRDR